MSVDARPSASRRRAPWTATTLVRAPVEDDPAWCPLMVLAELRNGCRKLLAGDGAPVSTNALKQAMATTRFVRGRVGWPVMAKLTLYSALPPCPRYCSLRITCWGKNRAQVRCLPPSQLKKYSSTSSSSEAAACSGEAGSCTGTSALCTAVNQTRRGGFVLRELNYTYVLILFACSPRNSVLVVPSAPTKPSSLLERHWKRDKTSTPLGAGNSYSR